MKNRRSVAVASPGMRKALAQQIREMYTWERRLYQSRKTGEPSNYTPGEKWDGTKKVDLFGDGKKTKTTSTWLRIADFVIQQQIDPIGFIQAQFVSTKNWAPQPNQVLGPKALARYRKQQANAPAMMQTALGIQNECFRTHTMQYRQWFPHLPRRRIWQVVLNNQSLEMTALFRYCIAFRLRFFRTAKLFKQAAAVQYVRNRDAYDSTWSDLLPEGFSGDAEVIYRNVLRTV